MKDIKELMDAVLLREALLKLVELEDRTLEGMSSGAPTAEEWRKAFDDARYVIDITRP